MYLRLQEYLRPASIEDCLGLLDDKARRTALLAGGSRLNVRDHEAITRLVDIQELPLGGISSVGVGVRLGALVTLADLVAGDLPPGMAALTDAAGAVRNLAIRNRSTVGGRLARNCSDARIATALLALGASVETHQPSAGNVTRGKFPVEAYLSRVSRGDWSHLVTAIEVPGGALFSAYASFSLTAMGAPFADAAIRCDSSRCRIATGCHGRDATGAVLLPEAANAAASIAGSAAGGTWKEELHHAASSRIPDFSDARASGEYRKAVAIALIERLVQAWIDERGGAA